MSTYILIHGAWHGGWCWDKVVPLLEAAGHRALAPDLPGHGQDPTPTAEITLQRYVDSVCALLDSQPEPVVLVGHSMAGAVITQVGELRPDKIRNLVYLTAYVLNDGQSIKDLRPPDSLVPKNSLFTPDGRISTVREDMLKPLFYADCSDEDVARAKMLLVPQNITALVTPVHTTPGNFGRLPRIYIECQQDCAISPETQKKLYTLMPCERVISMHASHSPFISQPQELARHLLSV